MSFTWQELFLPTNQKIQSSGADKDRGISSIQVTSIKSHWQWSGGISIFRSDPERVILATEKPLYVLLWLLQHGREGKAKLDQV